jgi:formylglycine-generating enzyme
MFLIKFVFPIMKMLKKLVLKEGVYTMSGKMVLVIFIVISMMAIVTGCSKKTTEASDRCATPQFNPAGGNYNTVQDVSISCATTGAEIHFTLDGSAPTTTSTIYADPVHLSSTATIKAIAFKDDFEDSHVASATYNINLSSLVHVTGGTYNNGSSEVSVSSFYIDKYETTQTKYMAIMGNNPSYFNAVDGGPVDQVTWFDAIEYCNKRSIAESLTPCYSYGNHGTNPANWPAGWNTASDNHTNVSCNWTVNGYRLPTNGEWYFAARGGTLSNNYIYSGSSNVDEVAWYSGNAGSTTHPCGLKLPNELGIYDMTGNVSEWVWDIYVSSLPTDAQSNPHGPTTGSDRTIRGGNLTTNASYSSMIYRYLYPATTSSNHIGIRVCRHSL